MWSCSCWSLSGSLGDPSGTAPVCLKKPSIIAWFLNDPSGGSILPGGQDTNSKVQADWAVSISPKIWQPNIWNANLPEMRENKNSGYAIMQQSKAVEFSLLCFIHSIITLCLLDQALLATARGQGHEHEVCMSLFLCHSLLDEILVIFQGLVQI